MRNDRGGGLEEEEVDEEAEEEEGARGEPLAAGVDAVAISSPLVSGIGRRREAKSLGTVFFFAEIRGLLFISHPMNSTHRTCGHAGLPPSLGVLIRVNVISKRYRCRNISSPLSLTQIPIWFSLVHTVRCV